MARSYGLGREVTISVRVRKSAQEALDSKAKERGLSRSEAVREALRDWSRK